MTTHAAKRRRREHVEDLERRGYHEGGPIWKQGRAAVRITAERKKRDAGPGNPGPPGMERPRMKRTRARR